MLFKNRSVQLATSYRFTLLCFNTRRLRGLAAHVSFAENSEVSDGLAFVAEGMCEASRESRPREEGVRQPVLPELQIGTLNDTENFSLCVSVSLIHKNRHWPS